MIDEKKKDSASLIAGNEIGVRLWLPAEIADT